MDIYFENRIYVNVQAEHKKDIQDSEYEQFYNQYLDSLTHHEVIGSHPFKDRQDVSGLYEVRYQEKINDTNWQFVSKEKYDWFHADWKRTVAVAITLMRDHPHPSPDIEKDARALVEKYYNALLTNGNDYEKQICWGYAKQCALISLQREEDLLTRLLETGIHNDFGLMAERAELKSLRHHINSIL